MTMTLRQKQGNDAGGRSQPGTARREQRPATSSVSGHSLDKAPLDSTTIMYLQRTAGNRSVAQLILQRKKNKKPKASKAAPAPSGPSQEELDKQARLGTSGALAGWASGGESNATERKVRGMWRIPLDGIPGGNAEEAKRTDTAESAVDRAIVIVPAFLGRAPKSVEVLLHLHGYGIGYRAQQGKTPQGPYAWSGAGEGKVRDEVVDRVEGQLEESGRAMVGILPQGDLKSGFGASFDSDAYIKAIFGKLVSSKIWDAAPTSSGVVLSGHSGAGATLASMLAPKQVRKDTDKVAAAPSGLREVVLFDAINGTHELASVTTWVTESLRADLATIKTLKGDDRLAYLETSMRFRGYHTHLYDSAYKSLKATIDGWFTANQKALGGKRSATFAKLRGNYTIKDADKKETHYQSHEEMIGHGDRMVDALSALPPDEEQVAFMNRVLAAHIAQGAASFKEKGKQENPDLLDAQLAAVAGTDVKMRSDAAAKAGELLATANADRKTTQAKATTDLKAAQEKKTVEQTSAGPPAPAEKARIEDLIPKLAADVLLTSGLSAASGYRGRAHQERLWKGYFRDKYYPATRKARANLAGGVHGEKAVAFMVRYVSGKIAAPGYSNHQAGVAIDFWQERATGHDIHNDTQGEAISKWRETWFWDWLNAHADTYGFLDFDKEPWHWALGVHG
jgi:hypothetical protein